MAYKLVFFMREFSKFGNQILHNYESKLKHHHDHTDEKAQLKNKYSLASQYIHSPNSSEWKIGLVELDNFVRMSLHDKGYSGETTLELIKDAKEKGYVHIKEAEDVAYLRQRLKQKGHEFDFSQKDLLILLKNFDEFKKTVIPEELSGHNNHK
jgi:hypothetical protein